MKEIKAYQQKRKGNNRRVLDTTHKTTRLNMESNCIQWVNIDIITAPPPPPPKTPWTKGTRLVYTRRFPNLPWPPRNGSGFSAQSCGSPSCRWYVLPVGRQHQTLFLHTQTHNRIKRSPQSKKKYLWNRNHNLSKTRVGSACHL